MLKKLVVCMHDEQMPLFTPGQMTIIVNAHMSYFFYLFI